MAELLDFCRTIQAEIDGKPTQNQCDGCLAGHPLVDGTHQCDYPSGNIGCTKSLYMSPPDISIIYITADWLEERGDPRVEELRELRIEEVRSGHGLPEARREEGVLFWIVLPSKTESLWTRKADAARELLRRALEMLTVPCPELREHLGSETYNQLHTHTPCLICSGRNWLPARVERCKPCGMTGQMETIHNDESKGLSDCDFCHGQKYVKVAIPIPRMESV